MIGGRTRALLTTNFTSLLQMQMFPQTRDSRLESARECRRCVEGHTVRAERVLRRDNVFAVHRGPADRKQSAPTDK